MILLMHELKMRLRQLEIVSTTNILQRYRQFNPAKRIKCFYVLGLIFIFLFFLDTIFVVTKTIKSTRENKAIAPYVLTKKTIAAISGQYFLVFIFMVYAALYMIK